MEAPLADRPGRRQLQGLPAPLLLTEGITGAATSPSTSYGTQAAPSPARWYCFCRRTRSPNTFGQKPTKNLLVFSLLGTIMGKRPIKNGRFDNETAGAGGPSHPEALYCPGAGVAPTISPAASTPAGTTRTILSPTSAPAFSLLGYTWTSSHRGRRSFSSPWSTRTTGIACAARSGRSLPAAAAPPRLNTASSWRDGAAVWCWTPPPDRGWRGGALLLHRTDIDERKQAEEALKLTLSAMHHHGPGYRRDF